MYQIYKNKKPVSKPYKFRLQAVIHLFEIKACYACRYGNFINNDYEIRKSM